MSNEMTLDAAVEILRLYRERLEWPAETTQRRFQAIDLVLSALPSGPRSEETGAASEMMTLEQIDGEIGYIDSRLAGHRAWGQCRMTGNEDCCDTLVLQLRWLSALRASTEKAEWLERERDAAIREVGEYARRASLMERERERMDWLESRTIIDKPDMPAPLEGNLYFGYYASWDQPPTTLREAIDQAKLHAVARFAARSSPPAPSEPLLNGCEVRVYPDGDVGTR